MDNNAKYRPLHSHRGGRRGNETTRGGNRNVDPSRDESTSSQQARRGDKQSQQVVNRSQQQAESTEQHILTAMTEQSRGLPSLNSAEVRDLLARGVEASAQTYKPDAGAAGAKAGNPWGTKPGTMANNKDFFLELRRQITKLYQQQDSKGGQGG